MPKVKRPCRTTAEIHSILSDLEQSGQSRRHFSINRNIPLSTLQSWIHKHGFAAFPSLPEVIPVGALPSEPSAPIEIEFPGGEILRLGPGCRGEDLRTVLSELRRC